MTDKGKARIVSVKLLALAAVLLSVRAGADSFSSPCQSSFMVRVLSESARREYEAWSHYALARYGSFSPNLNVKCGEEIKRALELLPESNELRARWSEYFREKPRQHKKAYLDYRKIFEAAPHNVDNAIFYVHLLHDAKKNADAERIIRKCYDETGRREGRFLCDWIVSFGLKERNLALERMIADFRQLPSSEDRWAVDVAEACYWFSLWEKAKAKNAEGKPVLSASTEEKSRWRARSLELLERLDISRLNGVCLYLVCATYEGYGEWKTLNRFLLAIKDKDIRQRRWWIEYCLKVAEKLDNYDELYDVLEEAQVSESWPLPFLQNVVRAYLKGEGHLKEAIAVQAMVAKKTMNSNDLLLLAELLLQNGDAKSALELLDNLPKDKLSFKGRMLRNRLLQANGKLEDAYQDFSILEFEAKMNIGKKHPPIFYYSFSMLCLKMKKIDEALDLAKRAQEMAPDNPSFCNYYGYILADFNRELDKAEKLILKALEKEPNNIAYIDSLAWVLFRKNDWRGAMREMARLIELGGLMEDDPDGEIRDHLKQIFTAAGMEKTAGFFEFLLKEDLK